MHTADSAEQTSASDTSPRPASRADLYDTSARELRVALVLYGGVSLAIYIYGVVLEFWRLVRASRGLEDNAYRALLEEAGVSATVDIVSGASAGGINGVLLAKALANGADLERCRSLWIERGDIARLLRDTSEREPRSLLRSTYFDEQLRDGLATMDAVAEKRPLVSALDLFVPATRLRGWVRDYVDDFGQIVGSRQYRKVFHLRYRSKGFNRIAPELGYFRNDFASDANELLAEVARATSAFPFAFEPKLIERRDDDPRFGSDEPEAEYFSDGGILHNRPFTEAIAALASRAADRPVDRWLASVEPDPERFSPETPPGPEPEVVDVVTKALSSIPRYESIASDLDRLNEYRRRVESRSAFLAELDEMMAASIAGGPGGALGAVPGGPAPPPIPDAARRLRERALIEDLVPRLLEAGNLEQSARPGVESGLVALDALHGDELGSESSLSPVDYAFEERRLQYLIEKLDRALETSPRPASEEARTALLSLWARHEEIEQALWETMGPESPIGLRLSELRGGSFTEIAGAITEILPEALTALSLQLARTRDRAAQVVSEADEALAHDLGYAPTLAQVFEMYRAWDGFLVSMDALGERPAREHVSFVRISPLAATYVRKPIEEKLAGDTLGHFGGFVERRWRENDVLWGRLDAAEVIVRMLHRGTPAEVGVEEAIRSVQEPIARGEIPVLAERPTADYRLFLEREYTVGGETLADVPIATRANLVEQGASVFRNMLRALAEHPPGGSLDATLRAIYRWLGRALGFVLTLTRWPVRAIWGHDEFWRRLATVVLLGGVFWATATVALIILDVIPDPSRRLWFLIVLAYVVYLVYVALLTFVDRQGTSRKP